MDEATQGVQTESAPQSEAPSQNNAPAEQSPSSQAQPEAQQPAAGEQQQPERKMAPVDDLISERQRRKQAEEYNKQLLRDMESRGIAPTPRNGEQPTQQQAPAANQQPEQPSYQPPRPDVDVEYVDANQFITRDQLDFRERESESWRSAKTEFSEEFESIPDLEDLAEGYRQRQLLRNGKFLTPREATAGVVKSIGSERIKAQQAATTSVKIQEQAAVQGSGSRPDAGAAEINKLKDDALNGSRKTRDAALKELIKRGAI